MSDSYQDLNVEVVQLRGSSYEIGIQQGKVLKRVLGQDDLDFIQPDRSKDFSSERATEALEQFAPHLLEEIKGLAKGLGCPFEVALELYSGYDAPFPEMGCSALVTEDFYARNYDFSPELYDARLVLVKPDQGYACVGMSQQIIGRLDGMNEKGLVIGLHLVNSKHGQIGFLGTSIVRMVLDQCKTTDEAIEFINKLPHGYSFNYSITDEQGNSVKVEGSSRGTAIEKAPSIACTNHFNDERLSEDNRDNIEGSLGREDYLIELAKRRLKPHAAFEAFNQAESPLFYKDYKNFFGTLHTVVYCPKELKMLVGIGGNSDPFTFSLIDWLKGKVDVPKSIKGKIEQLAK